jgi:hypothetical protein
VGDDGRISAEGDLLVRGPNGVWMGSGDGLRMVRFLIYFGKVGKVFLYKGIGRDFRFE